MNVTDIIAHIYRDIDGFALSTVAQKNHSYYSVGMIYDEASLDSFEDVLSFIKPQAGEIFYDLGSGVGKKVIAAACLYPFITCIGIELLADLWAASQIALARYRNYSALRATHIQFVQSDFSAYDFSNGDIFFLSLVDIAMEIELYGNLVRKLNQLKRGIRLITTDVPFLSQYYSVQGYSLFPFGNKGIYFIHTKII